jgi:predicted esterase
LAILRCREWEKKASVKRREKRKPFLIIHKNLDEFVTFRHLPAVKNKVTTAGMVMDKLGTRKA